MTIAEAVTIARDHLISAIPELANANPQIEELEVPPFKTTWRFTFSGILPNTEASTSYSLVEALRGRRVIKSVEIDASSGTLLAIKNLAA
jgi:hypothetical protein